MFGFEIKRVFKQAWNIVSFLRDIRKEFAKKKKSNYETCDVVHLSVRLHGTGDSYGKVFSWNFIFVILRKCTDMFQFWLKSDKNKGATSYEDWHLWCIAHIGLYSWYRWCSVWSASWLTPKETVLQQPNIFCFLTVDDISTFMGYQLWSILNLMLRYSLIWKVWSAWNVTIFDVVCTVHHLTICI